MRAPISSISQLIELQAQNDLPDEQRELAYELLGKQVQRTRNLLDRLLEWANNESQGGPIKMQPVNLYDLSSRILDEWT
ncbi:hypothetical protein RZS08_38000, partial [Arthrospira platensis SPKY1]|nr:hypothetical protein [Arthrospira platensis SPKY1]